ncbi:TMhelix containing protein [Vibrio phage 1.244.A._10N.261.54.C3]|nr:TMhelix containing protein [Vibrio phage 1.244.A._10N.261.54.C3]AUR98760.1 TMhelix containing protein [Vibrio phage 1.255.O._10N.286.45.F1]
MSKFDFLTREVVDKRSPFKKAVDNITFYGFCCLVIVVFGVGIFTCTDFIFKSLGW